MGTETPSWSVCRPAELVARSSGRYRTRTGDQDTRSDSQENSRVGEMGRGPSTRNTSCVPWSPDGSGDAFNIQVGLERPAEMVPRSPGEVLMENKVAKTHLCRADFEQRGLGEACLGWYMTTGQGRQQTYSEACRKRGEALLRGDSPGSCRLASADERINRALADAVERYATKDPGEAY